MKLLFRLMAIGFAAHLLASCEKEEVAAPQGAQPAEEAVPKPQVSEAGPEAAPAAPAVEEDMPDEEEPSAPDTDPGLVQPEPDREEPTR